jgi:hypothetical protein
MPVGLLALVGVAAAATFTVTHGGDAGAGSLRAALDSANAVPGFDEVRHGVASKSLYPRGHRPN